LDDQKKEIGLSVKMIRKKRGLNQHELAKKIGNIRAETISRIETGQANFRIDTLIKIAEALKIDLSTLCMSPDKISKNGFEKFMSFLTETYKEFQKRGGEID
jgi:transcriptional regulator with XRE-family HTH domain